LSWALERTSGPVVLVGHAYSGAVIAAVREDRVKSLVEAGINRFGKPEEIADLLGYLVSPLPRSG